MNNFNIKQDIIKVWFSLPLCFCILISGSLIAQTQADSCLVVPKGDGLLIQVSKLDGKEQLIGALGVDEVQAIAFNGTTDTLFAAHAGRLGTINPTTGAFTFLSQDYGSGNGSLGLLNFKEVEGLTYDTSSKVLFGSVKIDNARSILIKIDPSNGSHLSDAFGAGIDYIEISGAGVLPIVEDLAIHPATGEMYALSRETKGNDLLIKVDKTTGEGTVIGPLGEDVIEGLGFDNDGRLFATPGTQTSPPARFYEINLHTGAASTIAILELSVDYESCECLSPKKPNSAPIAIDDQYVTDINTQLEIEAPGVLSNDTDPNGDTLSIIYHDSTSIAGGIVDLNPDGSFSYNPPNGFEGDDSFSYVVTDDSGLTDTATVQISVLMMPTEPVANDDAFSTDKNTSLTVDAPGVLANDTDPNQDIITVIDYDPTGTKGGTVVVNPDGSLTFTPAEDSVGIDTFTYVISDGNGNSDTAVVSVTIIEPVESDNNPPDAKDDELETDLDSELVITDPAEGVLVNDSDPDGDQITVQEVTDGITDQGGRINIHNDGTLSYVPRLGFIGTDSVEYTICDDQDPQLCDSAMIYIVVRELPIEVFSAFSPNGDGINDTWIIQGITRFPENEVQIFNRWGNLIFKTTGYDNTSKVWKGNATEGPVFGSDEAPDGAYYYIIDLGDGSERLSGYVVIRR
ncbi:MAG: hypothetical protein DHS20C17_10540 [Cyclobacteriaceae bacterium]|nr:MAG: hypothetical protein DHS20C17_10540 [Cyclobacteriaceae bacterium]